MEAYIDASPFTLCAYITEAFKQLKGSRIGPGWLRQCKQLPVIATTAIQTLWPSSDADVMTLGAPLMINSCHSWSQNSDVIKVLLPEYFDPADPDVTDADTLSAPTI
ncbi:DUF2889 domain-containing protein [Amphritea sp. 1_MG-2023]|uniref:DUF2889 domain-containing protein n=1 Tax=Amphritea sp. 1_MG-2023 TaxID=3062670 RepID=UPI0026E37CBB|nr:DUF2889 domain-containing protein [Amphritea sp. 1_MG-2023]MDO6564904.1 DUF2889 domain-containing protein [Amphritea sp. 1_MG-2023]